MGHFNIIMELPFLILRLCKRRNTTRNNSTTKAKISLRLNEFQSDFLHLVYILGRKGGGVGAEGWALIRGYFSYFGLGFKVLRMRSRTFFFARFRSSKGLTPHLSTVFIAWNC